MFAIAISRLPAKVGGFFIGGNVKNNCQYIWPIQVNILSLHYRTTHHTTFKNAIMAIQLNSVSSSVIHQYATCKEWIGSFGYTYNGKAIHYDVVEMDTHNEEYLAPIYTEDHEDIFKCSSPRLRELGQHFFVKYNRNNGKIYFNKPEASDAGKVFFETKGISLKYLNFVDQLFSCIQPTD